jgi:hypothetical protein
VFFRFRPVPIVGFDLSITSGSLRYKDSASGLRIRQDHALWSVGMLLYLTQSKVAQFALSGGTGALAHVVRYDGRARDGKQVFGSGLVFVGAEGEFLLKRVGFILSIRMYGIGTPRSTRTSGQLFEGASSGEKRAPLPRFQTALLASAGVSIRF